MDEAADEQDSLREMVYSSHMVTWVEMGQIDELIETETDVLTGKRISAALESRKVAAVDLYLDVEMCRGVECEMLHVKPTTMLFSAYVDGWGDGLETGEIPRSEIRELART